MRFAPLFLASLSALTFVGSSVAEKPFRWADHYEITSITNPSLVDPQIGGMDLNSEGDLVVCFHRGEVMIRNAKSGEWRPFASGLHEPLGLRVEKSGTILVVQRAEVTRLHDKDGDGQADFYETVCDDWGMTGNYHEFAFGIAEDSEKNLYVSLGTASSGSGVREEIRGPWNNTGGMEQEDFLYGGKWGDWKERKDRVSRMYARVPYRGCVLRIEPGSSKAHVHATGLRTPNGLYVDAQDQLWVTDNQGDWVGASKLFRVKRGGFHGHAASLLWAENPPNQTPAKLPVEELDARRVRSAALIPQGDAGNSLTAMVPFKASFGVSPATAETSLLIGDMNHSRLVQYLPDVVDGQHQGAVTHFLDTPDLVMGNNRMVYAPDGQSLYLGKTHLSWPGREGMKKVSYNGKPYLRVDAVQLQPDGFEFVFNEEITAPSESAKYAIESYQVAYHAKYGSGKEDLREEPSAKIEINGRSLRVTLAKRPEGNRLYDISLPAEIRSKIGPISSNRFWYTAHVVR